MACFVRHDAEDQLIGEPLCPDCFDYPGAVLWNAHVPRLWERTSLQLYRQVAGSAGIGTSELRKLARLSYIKVVEFQRRGLVHLHVVVRADGAAGPAEPPPPWLGSAVLARAVEGAVANSVVAVPGVPNSALRRARWGTSGRHPGPRSGPGGRLGRRRRLRGQVRHQDGRWLGLVGPSDPLSG